MEEEFIEIYYQKPERKKNKKIDKSFLEGYEKVKIDYLNLFYGQWVKTIDTLVEETNCGILKNLEKSLSNITIMIPRTQEEEVVNLTTKIVYVNKNSVNFLNYLNLLKKLSSIDSLNKQLEERRREISEKEKEMKIFQLEKRRFYNIKEKFLSLFREGKIKICV